MKKILFALTIISLILIYSACSFTCDSTVTVSPVIRAIGLPSASVISSVELTVSGPGMNTISVVYDSLPSSIELSIPSGSDRTFELEVFVDIPVIAAKSYKGTATADLSQNSTTIYLTMGVGSTKIVVPDLWWWNGETTVSRVLQFDDISGSNALSLTLATLVTQGLAGVAVFNPYDIDFDSQGRIYIANYDGANGGIIRVDNITGLNPVIIATGFGAVKAVTIDQQNGYLYYIAGNNTHRYDLNSSNDIDMGIGGEVLGTLAVKNNSLYITDMSILQKYDLESGEFKATVDLGDISTISDIEAILVKGDKLYIGDEAGSTGYQILEFSTSDLRLTNHYGNPASAVNTSKGNFYGPRRFVAQMNDELTIIDDYKLPGSGLNFDKIIQMDNIDGDNWKTLPASVDDDGQTLFEFFIHNTVV